MLFCSVLNVGIGCFCSILEGALELEDFGEEFLIATVWILLFFCDLGGGCFFFLALSWSS